MQGYADKTISKEDIRCLYGLGAALGMVVRGQEDDPFHILISGFTGKNSIKDLTGAEFATIKRELIKRGKLGNRQDPLKSRESAPARKRHAEVPGGITADQQRKVWRLMYALKDCDVQPNDVLLGERLCAIIRKELHRDCTAASPFRFIAIQDGHRLIEILKKYVANAERRRCDSP